MLFRSQRTLAGYRHELGSLLHLEAREELLAGLEPEQRDLLLHLVLAHHGRARPTVPIDGCDEAPPFALRRKQQEAAERFIGLQERWGPWGLAWWETLLRACDFRASARHEELS